MGLKKALKYLKKIHTSLQTMDIQGNESNLAVFKQDVTQFADIERKIKDVQRQMKPFQTQIKELRAIKKELEQDVCTTLLANDLKQIESTENNVILEHVTKKAMVPMTQKTVKDKMIDFFEKGPGSNISFNSKNGQQKGFEIFDYIYGKSNRDYKTKEQLKVKSLGE